METEISSVIEGFYKSACNGCGQYPELAFQSFTNAVNNYLHGKPEQIQTEILSIARTYDYLEGYIGTECRVWIYDYEKCDILYVGNNKRIRWQTDSLMEDVNETVILR